MNEEIKQINVDDINFFVEFFYLFGVTWTYVMSLIYPFFGIILGIVFSAAGKTEKIKKVGRICLILGIINLVLGIIFMAVILLTQFIPFARQFVY